MRFPCVNTRMMCDQEFVCGSDVTAVVLVCCLYMEAGIRLNGKLTNLIIEKFDCKQV